MNINYENEGISFLSERLDPSTIFSNKDSKIKEDIIRLIAQYLNEEGYQASKLVIMDETLLKSREREDKQLEFKRIRKAILDGDWPEVDRLSLKPLVKNHKSFLYAIYKTQYLEYIDHHETQKAFNHLLKRLKPLEHFQTTPNEFHDLCYLLTVKSVQEAQSHKSWEGVTSSREELVEQLENMLEIENTEREGSVYIPPGRLLRLLKDAFAYQMEFSRNRPKSTPKITTLLQDYTSNAIPNNVRNSFIGHCANVKCVEFIGEKGELLISGSSDNTCRIWETNTGECLSVLKGHSGRIWNVSSNQSGTFCASGSGDGSIKLWNVKNPLLNMESSSTITGHKSDVYTVKFHPHGKHLASGGYDTVVRLFDIERGMAVKRLNGHSLSISEVIFSPLGNLIISGSKDHTIKFWDIVSGLCIKTLSSHLGEVTSVEMNSNGTLLLSSSKDNSNRLWDIRMLRPIRRFKGHQNTSKNFIKARFAGDSIITGGSEDGNIHIWDSDKGDLIQKLRGHDGVVYCASWNRYQSLFASCSDDNLIKTWNYQEN